LAAKQCDVLIIGDGLVGLATALHLQTTQPRLRCCLIDKSDRVATHQSGRNSGVVHAGIYYEPGSLKARLCVDGKSALKDYCGLNEIPYQACGKVIVASNNEEVDRLDSLLARGLKNKVPGLRLISQQELQEIEPGVFGLAALYSPETAIVDYIKVAESYARDFVAAGGMVYLESEFQSASEYRGSRRVLTSGHEFEAGLVVNCAGLHADVVAKKMGASPDLRIVPFRGDFFDLVPESAGLVKALIYPVPDPALPFLGVHLTPTVQGAVRAGPNAILATQREGYSGRDFSFSDVADTLSYAGFWRFSARYMRPGLSELNRSLRKSVFVKSIQKLVPDIQADDLMPSRSGVRAQAVDREGRMVDDFRIDESPGAIHVLNAPSPAATSSMMIGKFVASKVELRINAD
jgi:L-2-hydroxyglutarate oxidase